MMFSTETPNFSYLFSKKVTFQILTSVEFGMPSKNCRNFGVCRIEALKEISAFRKMAKHPNSCSTVIALLTLFNTHDLELSVFKTTVSNTTEKLFFMNASFLVKEDFSFSPTLTSDLGYKKLTIPVGSYKIEHSSSCYNIHFNELLSEL